MPISDEMKRLYSSNGSGLRHAETLTLRHPAFLQVYHFTNNEVSFLGRFEGGNVSFLPYPFQVKLPSTDDKGVKEMQIALALDAHEIRDEIERAEVYRLTNSPISVTATFCEYLINPGADTVSGAFVEAIDPITLYLSSIEIKPDTVAGSAGLADVVNMTFPRQTYTSNLFPGLVRG